MHGLHGWHGLHVLLQWSNLRHGSRRSLRSRITSRIFHGRFLLVFVVRASLACLRGERTSIGFLRRVQLLLLLHWFLLRLGNTRLLLLLLWLLLLGGGVANRSEANDTWWRASVLTLAIRTLCLRLRIVLVKRLSSFSKTTIKTLTKNLYSSILYSKY